MIIRDSNAPLEGNTEETHFPRGSIDIIADDGRTLFTIGEKGDGVLEISTGGFCKHNGEMLDSTLDIRPIVSNVITVRRPSWEGTPKKKD